MLDLDDARAQEPEVAGAKASALSRARAAKLPALTGFVVTTEGVRALVARDKSGAAMFAVHDKWRAALRERGTVARRSVVVAQRGRRVAVDGRHVHVGARRAGLAGIPRRGRRRSRVRAGAPIAGTRPTVLAAGVGRRALRRRPRDRALRPSRRCRSAGRPRPVGVRRSRWRTARALAARSLARGERRRTRRAAKPEGAPTAGSSRCPRSRDLRRPPGHRVGHRGERLGGAASEPADHGARRRGSGRGPVFGPGPVAETFGFRCARSKRTSGWRRCATALREALTLAGATSGPTAPRLADRRHGRWARRSRSRSPRAHAPSSARAHEARPPPARPPAEGGVAVGRLKVALPALAEDLIAGIDADLRSRARHDDPREADLVRLLRRSHQTLVALHGARGARRPAARRRRRAADGGVGRVAHLGRAGARDRGRTSSSRAPRVARPRAPAHQHRARAASGAARAASSFGRGRDGRSREVAATAGAVGAGAHRTRGARPRTAAGRARRGGLAGQQ